MPHPSFRRERRALFPAMLLVGMLATCAGLLPPGRGPISRREAAARFTAIGGEPTGVLICGSDMSGAYRSLDHGLTWDRIGNDKGIRRSHISALAFDPVDAQIYHLGTDVGLYHTGDGGASFVRVIDNGYIGAIAHAWTNPAVVYAARNPSFDTLTTRHLPQPTTMASHGHPSRSGSRTARVLELVGEPAGLEHRLPGLGHGSVRGRIEAVYRSSDAGVTWTRIGASLGKLWDLAIDPRPRARSGPPATTASRATCGRAARTRASIAAPPGLRCRPTPARSWCAATSRRR